MQLDDKKPQQKLGEREERRRERQYKKN